MNSEAAQGVPFRDLLERRNRLFTTFKSNMFSNLSDKFQVLPKRVPREKTRKFLDDIIIIFMQGRRPGDTQMLEPGGRREGGTGKGGQVGMVATMIQISLIFLCIDTIRPY